MIRKTDINTNTPARLFGIRDLMGYTGLGATRAAELGEKAGAKVCYGRRVLYDRAKIDAYIDSGAMKQEV